MKVEIEWSWIKKCIKETNMKKINQKIQFTRKEGMKKGVGLNMAENWY